METDTVNYVVFFRNEETEFDSFRKAFSFLFHKIKKALESSMTWQELETFIWLEVKTAAGTQCLYWYDARDLAYGQGIMQDGKLVAAGEEV